MGCTCAHIYMRMCMHMCADVRICGCPNMVMAHAACASDVHAHRKLCFKCYHPKRKAVSQTFGFSCFGRNCGLCRLGRWVCPSDAVRVLMVYSSLQYSKPAKGNTIILNRLSRLAPRSGPHGRKKTVPGAMDIHGIQTARSRSWLRPQVASRHPTRGDCGLDSHESRDRAQIA